MFKFCLVKCEVIFVILKLYSLWVVDFVLVLFGLIFIIISGKIWWLVCVECYCSDGFKWLDVVV